MPETTGTTTEVGNNPAEGERTFTQSELNAIVGKRLAEEQAKYAGFEDYKKKAEAFDKAEEANKSDLQKANERADKAEAALKKLQDAEAIRAIRQKASSETGVPIDLLTGIDEESCMAQANAIKAYAGNTSGYPSVKDGGETRHTAKKTAAEQFADWFGESMKR